MKREKQEGAEAPSTAGLFPRAFSLSLFYLRIDRRTADDGRQSRRRAKKPPSRSRESSQLKNAARQKKEKEEMAKIKRN